MEVAFTINSIVKILAALILVAFNGLFVAAEFALVRVRPTRIAQLVAQGKRQALRTRRCINNLDAYLSVSQLGITLASLGLGWLGEPALASLLSPLFSSWGLQNPALVHSLAFLFAFTIITFLHVVFGELLPKSLSIQKTETLALILAGPMQFFYYIFYPGVILLNGTANKILDLWSLGDNKNPELIHSEEELRMLISSSYQQGEINQSEQELLQNVFKFDKKVVEEIMVPRPQVVFLDRQQSFEANLTIARQYGHTRYPLCDGDPDHVVGLIHIKDIFFTGPDYPPLEEIKRDILLVPEGLPLDNLLREFQNEHQHLAVVVDEYGGTAGIVTMDNILEELVGDIQDEFDQEEPEISLQPDGTISVSGAMLIDEAAENLGLPLKDENRRYNTLAGYIMEKLGRFPRVGDTVSLGIFNLEVAHMESQRINRIRLYPIPEKAHLSPEQPPK